MTTTHRKGAFLGAALLVASLPVAAAAPAGAAPQACQPGVAPSVLGSGRTTAVVTVPQCDNDDRYDGYRILAYRSGSDTPETWVDVGNDVAAIEVTGLEPGQLYRLKGQSRDEGRFGPPSISSARALLPFPTISAFTDRQYLDLTGAAATSAQRATWKSGIDATPQTLTPARAAESLVQGTWWQVQSPVIRLYQAYFLRLPDKGGLDHWAGRSRTGIRLGAISANFAASSEFTRRYGSLSNRAFVERVYRNVLDRPGDPAGIASWTAKLDARTRDRGSVMVGFSESNEYRNRTATTVDAVNVATGLLRRVPSAAELDRWRTAGRRAAIAEVLASAAYAKRVGVTAPPHVTTRTVPTGVVGRAYPATTLTADFGRPPLRWALDPGSAAGFTLSSGGVLGGTPRKQGDNVVGVVVTDADGRTGRWWLTVNVQGLAITSPAELPGGTVGVPYSYRLTVEGVTGTARWEAEGNLPGGLSLAPDGTISGTPYRAETDTVYISVIDSAGRWGWRFFTFTIAPAPGG